MFMILFHRTMNCTKTNDHENAIKWKKNMDKNVVTKVQLKTHKCHVYSQFYMRPLDLCSACLVVLQCQQPCMTRSTGWVSRSVSRSSYVCWHTSVCTVWHPTTCRTSARYWPLFLAVLCYVQLTQTNCWYHGSARPALDCVPLVLLVRRLRISGYLAVPIANGGGDRFWKWKEFQLSRARASLIDLYLHTKFHWDRKKFFSKVTTEVLVKFKVTWHKN